MGDAGFALTVEERDQVVVWSRGSSRLAKRAQIVLALAEAGVVLEVVASEVGVARVTVAKSRDRFAAWWLDGLLERRRLGRPKRELVLSVEEQQQLERWARRLKSGQGLALRCRIVLGCAEGRDKQAGGRA